MSYQYLISASAVGDPRHFVLVSYAKDELMRAKACNILLEFITLLVGSL
jgi:hypothetical protein